MLDLKLLWRDWRGGQLNLIVSALVLAVMVVTAVSLLADRVERGLDEQISSFLAADMAIQGGQDIQPRFAEKAGELNIATADIALFRSMVFAGDRNHLASLKAVDSFYPLRGQIQITGHLDANTIEMSDSGPNRGEAWVEARLLTLLESMSGELALQRVAEELAEARPEVNGAQVLEDGQEQLRRFAEIGIVRKRESSGTPLS